jgi:hypothetical protein
MAEEFTLKDILSLQELSDEDKQLVSDKVNSVRNDDSVRIDMENLSSHSSSSYLNSDFNFDAIEPIDLDGRGNPVSSSDQKLRDALDGIEPFNVEPEESFSEMIGNGVSSAGNVLSDTFVGMVAGVGGGFVEMAESISDGADIVTNALGFDINTPIDTWSDAIDKKFKKIHSEAENPTVMAMSKAFFQFMSGFIPIFGALGKIKSTYKLTSLHKTIIADGLTGAFAFDPDDPDANPIAPLMNTEFMTSLDRNTGGALSEFLVSDHDDIDAEKRLKNAMSGVIAGRLIDGAFEVIKWVGKAGVARTKGLFGKTEDLIGPKMPAGYDDLDTTITQAKEQSTLLKEELKNPNLNKKNRTRIHAARLATKRRIEYAEYQKKVLTRQPIEGEELKSILQVDELPVDAESRIKLDELMSMELPNNLKRRTPHYPKGQGKIDFPDDVTKSLYIVRSAKGAKYREFLRKQVGLDDSEIDELSEMVVQDVNARGEIEPFALYRENLRTALALGDVKSTVKMNDIVAQKGIKVIPVPTNTAGDPMVELVAETERLTQLKNRPQKYKFETKPVAGKHFKVDEVWEGQGEVPVVKGTDGVEREFRFNLGAVKTPEDYENLFNWMKVEFAEDIERGAGRRINLDDEIALAIEQIPEIMSSPNPQQLIKAMGVNPSAAAIARVAHIAAFKNMANASKAILKKGRKSTPEMRNSMREAMAFWHGMKKVVAEKARLGAQTTRMFGHMIDFDMVQTDVFEKLADKSILNTGKTEGGAFLNMAQMIADADSPQALDNVLKTITEKSGLTDIFVEHYMGVGLLSGIKTQLANLFGTGGVALGVQPAEMFFQNMWKKFLGHQYKDSATVELVAGYQGLINSWREWGTVFKNTIWHDRPTGFGVTKMDGLERRAFTPMKLGVEDTTESRISMLSAMGRLNRGGAPFLLATDDAFRTMIHRMNVGREAYRQAFEEGLSPNAMRARERFLSANPAFLNNYRSINLKSTKLADEALFVERLGIVGSALSHIATNIPILRLFTPFIKVMWNLADFALKRDPISNTARLTLSKRFRDQVFDNPEATTEFLSRMSTGVMMVGTGTMLAMEGFITGSEEANYKKVINRSMVNHKATSLRIEAEDGSVINYDYSRLEPYASFLQWSADLVKILGSSHPEENEDIIYDIAHSIQDNIVSDTWVPGLAAFTELLTTRYKDEAQGRKALERFVNKIASGFTPSLLREIESVSDNRVAQSRGGELNFADDKFAKYGGALRGKQNIDKIIAKMLSNLPGHSKNSIAKLDRWGNVMLKNGDITDLTPLEYITPFTAYRKKYDKIDERLDQLEIEIGDPSDSLQIQGFDEPVRLSKKQYEQLVLISTKDLSEIDNFIRANPSARIPPSMIERLKGQGEYSNGSIKTALKKLFGELDQLRKTGIILPESGNRGEKVFVKNLFVRRRKIARRLIPWIIGNEDLMLESQRRSKIIRENPTINFD